MLFSLHKWPDIPTETNENEACIHCFSNSHSVPFKQGSKWYRISIRHFWNAGSGLWALSKHINEQEEFWLRKNDSSWNEVGNGEQSF